MKNFLTTLILSLIMIVSFSQNEAHDAELGYTQTFKLTGQLSDYLSTTDSTFSYVVEKRTDSKIFVIIDISLDSISGTPDTVDVYLDHKAFDSNSFTGLDTVIYYGTVDTVIRFETTTALLMDYWRVRAEERGNDFRVQIDYLNWKFGK